MEGFYGWIRNIVYFLILMTVITNLLPSGKYEKYLRLFSGCVLILLVLQPLTGSLRLEESIDALFHTFSFENDAGELGKELDEMESRRLSVLADRYEQAASEDIARLAAMEGLEARQVSVEIERRKDSPDFGRMRKVTVVLRAEGMGENGTAGADEVRAVELVDPVNIQVVLDEEEGGTGQAFPGNGEQSGEKAERQSGEKAAASGSASIAALEAGTGKLKQEIAGCYQVEERYVEIRLEDE